MYVYTNIRVCFCVYRKYLEECVQSTAPYLIMFKKLEQFGMIVTLRQGRILPSHLRSAPHQ